VARLCGRVLSRLASSLYSRVYVCMPIGEVSSHRERPAAFTHARLPHIENSFVEQGLTFNANGERE